MVRGEAVEWGPQSETAVADEPDDVREIEVLESNWTTVQVYLRCIPEIQLGMSVYWQGVTPTQIASACWLMSVPRAERMDVLDGAQHMAQVVAEIRNREANKK